MAYIGNIILGAFAWVITYTGTPVEPAIILAVLMTADCVAGVAKAHATGAKFESDKLKIGAFSKFLMLTIPLFTALAAKGLGVNWVWLVNWVVSVMILSELYSFIANVYAIRTRKDLPEWDAMAMIGKKIRSLLEAL